MRPTDSPETSNLKHLTACNNPEDARIQVKVLVTTRVTHNTLFTARQNSAGEAQHTPRSESFLSVRVVVIFYYDTSDPFKMPHNYRTGAELGLDSSVGITTRYGLDGPGIECRWGRDFTHPSRPALGLTQPHMQWVPGFFLEGKANGAWRLKKE